MTGKTTSQWPFGPDLSGFFAKLKLPLMPDMEALMAAQRRNIEALTQAYQVTQQSGQELARRHMENFHSFGIGVLDRLAQFLHVRHCPLIRLFQQLNLLRRFRLRCLRASNGLHGLMEFNHRGSTIADRWRAIG